MTHCNDQLIDQLLTQANKEGRPPDSPEHGDPKSAPSVHRRHDRLPHAGLFARKMRWDELNRAQRHCEIIRALAIVHPDWTFCCFRQHASWDSKSRGGT